MGQAWINVGRLLAESGQSAEAGECFESALALDPFDATAIYNLGVVAQDAGHEADAIVRYTRALELDPSLAEAHYNLATLFDRGGDARAAIRHINAYRRLVKPSGGG
ncbi:MAG: tetratricopeptide repeat protein [Kofleriaceae bacterium]